MRTFWPLLALAACGGDKTAPTDSDADTDTDTDADTDTDTDADTDADTDTDTDTDVHTGAGAHTGFVHTALTPPLVHLAGTLVVRGTWSGDLDAGVEGVYGYDPTMDFFWEIVDPTHRQLTPKGGATFAVMGQRRVGAVGCASAVLSGNPIDASGAGYGNLAPGTWLCARTSDGRLSAFEIVQIDAATNYELTIDFTTWQ